MTETVSVERLAEISEEFAGLKAALDEGGGLPDGPGAVSAFYTSLSAAEGVALARAATALASAEARIAELTEALAPIADACVLVPETAGETEAFGLSARSFRRARAALARARSLEKQDG